MTSSQGSSNQESTRISMKTESAASAGMSGTASETEPESLERRYASLIDSIYDALLITDLHGKVVDANPRSSDLLLYERHEMKDMRMLDVIVGFDENLLCSVRKHLEKRMYCVFDAKCVRKDNSRVSVEIAVSLMGSGSESRLCFFIRDITVRKQAEKALKGALEKLERQDRARALLISNVSHELRTPLTSLVYGIATLLQGGGGPLNDKQRAYVERFYRECRRLLGTVEDILDLERVETHTLKLSRVNVPVARLLERSISVLDLMSRHKGLEIRMTAPALSGFISCDPAKMERVFVNIIGNSIKYTPTGGTVVVAATPHTSRYGFVVMSVEDTGIGIPAFALEKVATRYFRVGEQGDGSGLGLSIAKEITDAHGGGLEILSPPPGKNRGTLVSVTMPTVEAPEIAITGGTEKYRGEIHKWLGGYGYRVEMFQSCRAVMERIVKKGLDAALLLFPLEGMDFVELVGELRNSGNAAVPAMFVLADTPLDATKKEIAESQNMAVLQAGLTMHDLLDAIEEGMARREQNGVISR